MSKWEVFKLKTTLLKIWAIKNLTVFLELFMYILIILVLTGQIGEDTPVFVWFGLDNLSSSINDVLTQEFSMGDMLLKLVTLVSSAIVVVGTISAHSKRIALKDIKDPILKSTLIRAGLYFNKDGKLVKRIEEAVKIDIDGDNKIGDVDVEDFPKENLFQGLKRSGQEFATIITFKPGTKEDVDKLIETNNMVQTTLALQEIDEEIKESREEITLEDVAENVEAAKQFLQTEEGQALQAKVASAAQSTGDAVTNAAQVTGNAVTTGAKATGNFFVRAAKGTVHGLAVAGKFVLSGLGKGAKGVFHGGAAAGSWIKNGIIFIGTSIGSFFKNIFSKKEDPEQEAALAQILAAKKSENVVQKEEVIVENVVAKPEVTVEVIKTAKNISAKSVKEDPLEALRKKYGR